MFDADRAHAPTDGAHTDQALGDAEQQAGDDQNAQAQAGQALDQRREERQHAAGQDARQAQHNRAFGADVVRHSSGHGAAEQGGQVLRTDGQPGHHRAETQLLMHIAGDDRDRQPDADKGDEGVENDGDDLQGDRQGRGGGGRHGHSFAGGR